MVWALIAVGAFAGLLAVIAALGSLLPQEHVARRTLEIKQPPEAVWRVITDYASQPAWFPEVEDVERRLDERGREVWQMTFRRGGRARLETLEAVPPRRLVGQMADEGAAFSGRWEYEITPAAHGSQLTITEYGRIPNPLFRFLARFVIGHAATIESYLQALAHKFGEPAVIQ
jgi:uncharacterized protein YndB with AHSA1/START domain